MFENHRRGRQARNFTTNVPKILTRDEIRRFFFCFSASLAQKGKQKTDYRDKGRGYDRRLALSLLSESLKQATLFLNWQPRPVLTLGTRGSFLLLNNVKLHTNQRVDLVKLHL